MKYNRYEDLKLVVFFFYGKNKFIIIRKFEWLVLDLLFLRRIVDLLVLLEILE